MSFRVRGGWIVFQAANDVEDCVVGKHDFKKGIFIEQENILEDLVQEVETLHVLQVLAGVEHGDEFLNVTFVLERYRQLFPSDRRM